MPGASLNGCQCECVGQLFLTMHSQAQAGAIEEATLAV